MVGMGDTKGAFQSILWVISDPNRYRWYSQCADQPIMVDRILERVCAANRQKQNRIQFPMDTLLSWRVFRNWKVTLCRSNTILLSEEARIFIESWSITRHSLQHQTQQEIKEHATGHRPLRSPFHNGPANLSWLQDAKFAWRLQHTILGKCTTNTWA